MSRERGHRTQFFVDGDAMLGTIGMHKRGVHPLMYRLAILVVLLAFDWYLDTSFGTSPFNLPMRSTEVVCYRPDHRQTVERQFEELDLLSATASVSLTLPTAPFCIHVCQSPASDTPVRDPGHLLISMQC
jgi:hypothetical protein